MPFFIFPKLAILKQVFLKRIKKENNPEQCYGEKNISYFYDCDGFNFKRNLLFNG
jgi:thioredoxin reductase